MMTLSASAEDYLKTIYKLRAGALEGGAPEGSAPEGGVTTQAVSSRLGVSPPSATAMVKKLAALKLVEHTPYYGVTLTGAGEKIALEVIRHHRLVETFLVEVLGVDWEHAHQEAEKWEHVLSEEVEAKMDEALRFPTRDPHGAPIPTLHGDIARDNWGRLADAEAGQAGVVRRVSDEDGPLLRHLREVGLVPGQSVRVRRAVAEEGVLHLEIAGREQIIGARPASAVFVEWGAIEG